VVLPCRAALHARTGSGVIVNVSSIATRGVNRVPYGAAKGGVNALTACLAFETAGRGIRVNATAPGGTEAPPRRVPRNSAEQSEQEKRWYQQIVDQTLDSSLMHRYGSIDEQVGAILFLASDEASYITGVTLPVGAATSAELQPQGKSFLPQQKQERQMPCEPLMYTRSSTMRAFPRFTGWSWPGAACC
jgi:NAD(P)-dependent dehydrogenase (short-subunit alcohol dehydrogenase family)